MFENIILNLVNSFVQDKENWISSATDTIKQIYQNRLLEYYKEKTEYFSRFKSIIRKDEPLRFYDAYIHQRIKKVKHAKVFKINSPSAFFKENKYSLILGDAGSGKSTLVKYMFLESIREAECIPILIELRALNAYEGRVEAYIIQEIFQNKIATSENVLRRQLSQGRFIFFLDGYDETVSDYAFARNLSDFINENSSNKFFLTSRPGANIEFINLTSTFKILPIAKDKIPSFIKKQSLDKELEKDIIKSIHENIDNKYISDFLGNPLLLLIYIITYRSNPNIPKRRSIFYRRVIDTLFVEHDSTKLGFKRLFDSNLNQEGITRILEAFSFLSFFEGMFDYQKDYIFQQFEVIRRITNTQFSSNELIADLVKSTSIWQEDMGIYSFIHKSIQEYFAAIYIKKQDEKTKIDFFNTIKTNILLDNFDIKEIKNLFDLYYEIDEHSYYKYFVEPIIDEIQGKGVLTKNPQLIITLLYKKVSITKEHDKLFISGKENIIEFVISKTSLHKVVKMFLEDKLMDFDHSFQNALKKDLLKRFKINADDYTEFWEIDFQHSKGIVKDLYAILEDEVLRLAKYIDSKSKLIKNRLASIENVNMELLNIIKRKPTEGKS